MAKELPYFKFEPAEWLTGRISLESLDTQGAFLNLCCLYWQRLGEVKIKEARLRLKDNYKILVEAEMIVEESDNVKIKFLDVQLVERLEIRRKASEAGKKSAQKRATSVQRPFKGGSTSIQQNRIEENKIELLEKFKKWADESKLNVGMVENTFLQAWDYYQELNWHNSKGKPIKNLYLTIRNNWFKNLDEFKARPKKPVLRNWDDVDEYLKNGGKL